MKKWFLLVAGLLLLVMAYIFWQQKGLAPRSDTQIGGSLEGSPIGGDFRLQSHLGQDFSSADLKGRYALIYFGYSFCPDVCPLELQKITALLRLIEEQGVETNYIQPLFITIDPERDTVDALARYMPLFHERFIGLTGSPEAIRSMTRSYRIYSAKREEGGTNDYLMDHTSLIFLMGPDGKALRFFSSGDQPAAIAVYLKNLDRSQIVLPPADPHAGQSLGGSNS